MSDQIVSALAIADIFDSLTQTQLAWVAVISEPMTYQSGYIIIK